MNKFFQGSLRIITLYAKMEIAAGLLLAILVVGFVIFSGDRNEIKPSAPATSPTIQQ